MPLKSTPRAHQSRLADKPAISNIKARKANVVSSAFVRSTRYQAVTLRHSISSCGWNAESLELNSGLQLRQWAVLVT